MFVHRRSYLLGTPAITLLYAVDPFSGKMVGIHSTAVLFIIILVSYNLDCLRQDLLLP